MSLIWIIKVFLKLLYSLLMTSKFSLTFPDSLLNVKTNVMNFVATWNGIMVFFKNKLFIELYVIVVL